MPAAVSLGVARFVGASRSTILPDWEVSVYQVLDAVPHRMEEGADHQGGDYRSRQRVRVREGDQEIVERPVDGLKEAREHQSNGGVDQGAVYDDIDLVEAILQDGYPHGAGDAPSR